MQSGRVVRSLSANQMVESGIQFAVLGHLPLVPVFLSVWPICLSVCLSVPTCAYQTYLGRYVQCMHVCAAAGPVCLPLAPNPVARQINKYPSNLHHINGLPVLRDGLVIYARKDVFFSVCLTMIYVVSVYQRPPEAYGSKPWSGLRIHGR